MNNFTSDLSQIPHLSAERWQAARQRAIVTIRSSTPEPQEKHYASQQGTSAYPAWLTRSLIVLLAIVAIAGFLWSAGKQIMAADMLVTPLGSSPRLSPGWASAAILLSLLFGELGSILFMVATAVYSGRWKRLAFGLFAVLCAGLALIANVSITVIQPPSQVPVFEWAMTFIPPLAVLGIGLLTESMVMASLKARAEQHKVYQAALDEYHRVQARPEEAPNWKRTWSHAVYSELCHYKRDRDVIEALSSEDKFALVSREYHKHELWERFEIGPFQPTQFALLSEVSQGHGSDSLTTGDPVRSVSETSLGRSKSAAQETVRQYLTDHPEAVNLSVRKLGEAAGVSKTIAAEELAAFKNGRHS